MYSKKGVVYKLHAGQFINRPPENFINWGLFIKFKGLLCGNPTERGESLILNFWPPGTLWVQPRHRDCLPQARGFKTGKNTIHQIFTLSIIHYGASNSDAIFRGKNDSESVRIVKYYHGSIYYDFQWEGSFGCLAAILTRNYLASGLTTSMSNKGGLPKKIGVPETSEFTLRVGPQGSLLRLCCCASVCHSGKGTLDLASRVPRDAGRSCRRRPL